MSADEFFGRPINESTSSLEFDICEICDRRSATWVEIKHQAGIPVVRFACQQCHQDFISKNQAADPEIARQIEDEEELAEATRPGWIDDFIKDQESTGAIQSIDPSTVDINAAQLEEPTMEFSEPPEEFEGESTTELEIEESQQQLAPWAPKFIQEALFGPNPEQWLEEQGGYTQSQHEITVRTLGSFADHKVTSVKLSAIQCLQGMTNRFAQLKEPVLDQLRKYETDADKTVADYASQTINQIS